ncbi:unnamed protein product [Bursaphelenchus xylophilus]|nr:unnamed protein product [Bursaphelenchus xylophilus]CAG9121247.1 unnamed protein product [Bursaphelenchus xylophilus]
MAMMNNGDLFVKMTKILLMANHAVVNLTKDVLNPLLTLIMDHFCRILSDPVISPKSLYLPVNWCLRWTIVMLLPCLTISKRLQNPLDPYTIEGRAQVEAELEEDLRREFVRSSHVRKEDMVYKYPKKMFSK